MWPESCRDWARWTLDWDEDLGKEEEETKEAEEEDEEDDEYES